MYFTTPITVKQNPDFNINHGHQMLSIGSCFANMVAQKLDYLKFNILSNPFGIIFNPISIFNILQLKVIDESHFINRDGLVYHLDFHSEFCFSSKRELMDEAQNLYRSLAIKLKSANYLFITLGTAFVYEYQETGKIIANCHKLPSNLFIKRLLTVDEIKSSFYEFYKSVISLNPNLKIVFTLSPVRHTKDTLELNAVSKSILRIAIHEIVSHTNNTLYFPAFEIVNDELRDYRFFKPDLIHPNEVAEDYIFEKFETVFFDEQTKAINAKVNQIKQNLQHKVQNPNSESYKTLLNKTSLLINELDSKLDFEAEREFINSKMVDL